MPSWKRVIISGSDAALKSVTATAGFTGNLQGTATSATTASQVSMASATGTITSALVLTTTGGTSNNRQLRVDGGSPQLTYEHNIRLINATASWATSALTASYVEGASGVTINNNTDHSILTATGVAGTIQGEAGLQYSGSTLVVTGSAIISGSGLVVTGSVRSTAGFTGSLLGTSSWAARAQTASLITAVMDATPIEMYLTYVKNPGTFGSTQQLSYLSQSSAALRFNPSTNTTFTTASWALTASLVTGSIFTGANLARSASFALTASHVPGVTGITINALADNRVLTALTTNTTVQAEANLTFDGSTLLVTGNTRITNGLAATGTTFLTGSVIVSGSATGGPALRVTGSISATRGFSGSLSGSIGFNTDTITAGSKGYFLLAPSQTSPQIPTVQTSIFLDGSTNTLQGVAVATASLANTASAGIFSYQGGNSELRIACLSPPTAGGSWTSPLRSVTFIAITPDVRQFEVSGSISTTGSLIVSRSNGTATAATFDNLLTIVPQRTLPTGPPIPSGTFATSGSGVNLKPYFYNGSTWTALF